MKTATAQAIDAARWDRVRFPPWFAPFAAPARYKCAYGGRSASKTYTLSLWLIAQCYARHCRIGCARQFQRNLSESVKPSLEWAIHRLGLGSAFRIGRDTITCPKTSSRIFFAGIERNIEGIKGWHDLTHLWFEEAQTCREDAMDIIIPTIARGESETEIWFTWNPRYRTDWVWRRFVVDPRPDDVIRKITYADNPYHTPQAEAERWADKRDNPQRYAHIWEGEPDDGDATKQVLPYEWLSKCVDAHKKYAIQASRWPAHGGLDIADGGKDRNHFVARRGPCVEWQEGWASAVSGHLTPTAEQADSLMLRAECERLYYDGTGVGSPIRGSFAELDRRMGKRPYAVTPVYFGGEVRGKKRVYGYRRTNQEYFSNRAAQLGINLRGRAGRTIKLLEGDDVPVDKCLLINPESPRIEQYLAALSQPQWYTVPESGKLKIDKRGELAGDSPDPYDATAMAFARDSEEGLRR